MRQILEASGLFEVVNGTDTTPTRADANFATKIVTWKKSNAKARRVISTTCKKQPLLEIMNCETANAMWQTLKSTYV